MEFSKNVQYFPQNENVDHTLQVALHGETNKLYACEIRRSDQFERKVGGGYNEAEFQEHPERYISNFSNKYAPYASVIVNG